MEEPGLPRNGFRVRPAPDQPAAGTGFVPYSPLGRGFLTGTIGSLDQLDADDWRRSNPRFEGDDLEANIRIVEQVDDVGKQLGATPAQVALAWLLAQGDDNWRRCAARSAR